MAPADAFFFFLAAMPLTELFWAVYRGDETKVYEILKALPDSQRDAAVNQPESDVRFEKRFASFLLLTPRSTLSRRELALPSWYV